MQPQALPERNARRPKIEDGQMAGVRSGLWQLYKGHRSEKVRSSKRQARESNVDSGELRVQCTRLKYKEGGTGKIQMKHRSEGSPGKLSVYRERLGE